MRYTHYFIITVTFQGDCHFIYSLFFFLSVCLFFAIMCLVWLGLVGTKMLLRFWLIPVVWSLKLSLETREFVEMAKCTL